MWPDVDANDLFLMTFAGRCYGQRVINTFGWKVQEVTGPLQPMDLFSNSFYADAEYTAFEEAFLACLPSAYSLEETWLQRVFPSRVRRAILEGPKPGDIDAEALNQSQASISRHGVTAARWANGGIRLVMPVGAAYSENGLITAGHKATLGALANQMTDPIELNVAGTFYDLVPVIICKSPTPGALFGEEVVETNVQDQLRTQRTRVVGRGE